jgi:hypothetical protein
MGAKGSRTDTDAKPRFVSSLRTLRPSSQPNIFHMEHDMKIGFSLLAAACVAGAACVCVSTPVSAAPVRAEDASTYKKLADQVGPALVTVKFVVKLSGGGDDGDEGRDAETNGMMIEPTGLVLVSNAKMGGLAGRGPVRINPTDIKVLQGDDTEGLKAKILARDSELDLCWVQIDDPKAKDKKFPCIDLAAGATVNVGDTILVVDRMGKFFDRAVIVDEARVGGTTHKPRNLIVPTGLPDRRSFNTLGMGMFTPDGKLVGVNILQMPGKEDMEGGGDMGEGNAAVLVLPAAELVKATARGKEMGAKSPVESNEPKKPTKSNEPKDGHDGDAKEGEMEKK